MRFWPKWFDVWHWCRRWAVQKLGTGNCNRGSCFWKKDQKTQDTSGSQGHTWEEDHYSIAVHSALLGVMLCNGRARAAAAIWAASNYVSWLRVPYVTGEGCAQKTILSLLMRVNNIFERFLFFANPIYQHWLINLKLFAAYAHVLLRPSTPPPTCCFSS